MGGTEERIGIYSATECVKKCQEKQAENPEYNGVTHNPEENICWCEIGMTGAEESPKWNTCFLPGKGVKGCPSLF